VIVTYQLVSNYSYYKYPSLSPVLLFSYNLHYIKTSVFLTLCKTIFNTMPCDDCKTGFQWNGTPIGKESTPNGAAAYVTGDSTDTAILVLTGFFGHTLPNIRILADHYAKEAKAAVYVPDM
jgi:hypothetical protein